MKNKFKNLQNNQIAYFTHGMSETYKAYHSALLNYVEALKENKVTKENSPKPDGNRFTLSAVLNKENGDCYVAMALCSSNDNFSRKLGRKLAIDKAIVFKDKNGEIKSGDPIAYFKINNIDSKIESEIKKEIFSKLLPLKDNIEKNPEIFKTRFSKTLLAL
jgi:hypothetical protein